jgi:hypothetical protein
MNCRESQSVLGELARDQMMDASGRQSALAHAASCQSCARRLEDARALTGGLRHVAAMDAHKEAPARVEMSLVAAFRERHSGAQPVSASGPAATRRWWYIAAGVAAAAVMAILISLVASQNQNSGTSAPKEAKATDEAPAGVQAPMPAPRSPEKQLVSTNRKGGGRPIKPVIKSKPGAPDANGPGAGLEIATDFFPLVNREALNQLDNGQLVRVELPRSALMSFGLPMNMERASERIKADIVVGEDGLARAIRFVR